MGTPRPRIDFSTLPDQPTKVDFSTLPDQPDAKTPNMARNFVKNLATEVQPVLKNLSSYPMGLPANPLNVEKAISSGNPSKAYYELMPQFEKGAEAVGSAVVVKNLATEVQPVLKNLSSYPMGLPANPLNVEKAISSGNPSKAYYELMPQFEKGAEAVGSAVVKSPSTKAFDIPTSKIPIVGNWLGNTNPISAIAQSVFPPRPSAMMAAAGGGAEARLPGVPLLSSPSLVQEGLGNATRELGSGGVAPEAVGNAAKSAYQQRVGATLGEMTKVPPTPEPQAPYVPRSGEEILNPKLQAISSQFGDKPVTYEQAGQQISGVYDKQVKKLLANEKTQWSNVSDKHFDKPATLENTKNYIESVFNQKGMGVEPSYFDRLNPNLQEAAMKSDNPEAYAKKYLESSQFSGAKNFEGNLSSEVPEKPTETPQLSTKLSKLNKIYEVANSNDVNFGQLKDMRTQLGDIINWNPGYRDSVNHTLKGVYKTLSDDMADSADSGGFTKDIGKAKQATKDFYNYTEMPSSQIISKTPYASDLMDKLIKSDSPERVNELFNQHPMTAQDKTTVQRALLDKMAYEANGDPKKYARNLMSYSPDTREALFGDKTDLVNSALDAAKELDAEIAKSKIKPPVQNAPRVYKPEDILSKPGNDLDQIMKNSNASEVVSKILSDGSPEMARVATSSIGKDAMPLVRRSAIDQITDGVFTKTPGGGQSANIGKLAANTNKLSPEFINEFFGNDAPTVNAIADASKYFNMKTSEANSYPKAARFLPFKERILTFLPRLFEKYNLPSKTQALIQENYGSDMANRLIPRKIPGVLSAPSNTAIIPKKMFTSIGNEQNP